MRLGKKDYPASRSVDGFGWVSLHYIVVGQSICQFWLLNLTILAKISLQSNSDHFAPQSSLGSAQCWDDPAAGLHPWSSHQVPKFWTVMIQTGQTSVGLGNLCTVYLYLCHIRIRVIIYPRGEQLQIMIQLQPYNPFFIVVPIYQSCVGGCIYIHTHVYHLFPKSIAKYGGVPLKTA